MNATAIPISPPRANLNDLIHTEGKAELIGGRVVKYMPSGIRPGILAKRILQSLDALVISRKLKGETFGDNVGYAVPELKSGRESFSPDVSYYSGYLRQDDMDFVDGPPTFAVEIRSKSNYGISAEEQIERKREDYFEAGTLAVWDVDTRGGTVTLYLKEQPKTGIVFKAGDMVHAGPTLAGWTMVINDIFVK